MTRKIQFLAISLGCLLMSGSARSDSTVKLTGWFSCDKCTAARVAKGDIRPSNPVCAKECIDKGDHGVFLSEQGKESLKVKNYATLTEDLGYHVEVTGVLDAAAKTGRGEREETCL